MALVPPIRASAIASTSFLPLLSSTTARASHSTFPLIQQRPSPRHWQRRYASSIQNSGARSVQDVERELEEQKQLLAKAQRMNPGMDVSSQVMPIFESVVDPPKPFWYFLNRWQDREYKAERKNRSALTRQAIGELIGRGGIDEYRNSAWRWSIPDQVRNVWLAVRRGAFIKRTLAQLAERYNEYNAIQASGTIGQANAVSRDYAFAAAQNVIRSRKDKMTWQLVKENEKPHLVSARITIVDPRDMQMAGQLVVRFDTQQALTTQKGNAAPVTRQQRVVENIIFERLVPPRDNAGWKIKGKLAESKPIPTPTQKA